LYHVALADRGGGWQAGLRVVSRDPAEVEVRGALGALAGQLGRDGEWARHLAGALATLRGQPDDPPQAGRTKHIRALATELAKLASDRLGDKATAERAWTTVLEVEPDAADAFDALIRGCRADQRWTDLRALLERRAE